MCESVTIQRCDALFFHAFVGSSGGQILVLFRSSTRPLNDHPVNAVTLLEPEGKRKFGLRQIARTALDHSRLRQAVREGAHSCADSVTVRFRAHQPKTNAAIARQLIVAVEIRGTVIRSQQQVQIAVTIEVRIRQSTADFWVIETSAKARGHVAESPLPIIEK